MVVKKMIYGYCGGNEGCRGYVCGWCSIVLWRVVDGGELKVVVVVRYGVTIESRRAFKFIVIVYIVAAWEEGDEGGWLLFSSGSMKEKDGREGWWWNGINTEVFYGWMKMENWSF